jgi:DNA processing protein
VAGREPKYHPPENARIALALEALGSLSALERKYVPDTLWLAGDESLLSAPARVAIVGSRKATAEGLRRAQKLSFELSQAGVVIVSGLAFGIDGKAHETALKSGGRTMAVIGTPITKCSPSAHARMQEEIAANHLLVSQFPPGRGTFPSDFIARNRTMALLSHASVIVEASDTSGALSQAAETRRLGRPLFIMQSVLEDRSLQWPERFLKDGAIALESSRQIIEAIARMHDAPRKVAAG